jgi:hypothetical protein
MATFFTTIAEGDLMPSVGTDLGFVSAFDRLVKGARDSYFLRVG